MGSFYWSEKKNVFPVDYNFHDHRLSVILMNNILSFREEIVAACGKQRDLCELVEGDRNRARQYSNLLILALYSFIPPSRALEIRTLEICHDWQSFNQKDYKDRNVLLIKGSEQVTLHFDSFKTVRWMGHQELTLKVRNY